MHSPLRSLPPPRPGRLPGRVAADCDHPQPAQIVARRPRPGRNGDGGSTGRLTQVARRAARPDSAGRNGATRATATAQDVENPRLRSFVQQPQTRVFCFRGGRRRPNFDTLFGTASVRKAFVFAPLNFALRSLAVTTIVVGRWQVSVAPAEPKRADLDLGPVARTAKTVRARGEGCR